ncbi:MAG: hypothetical protein IPM54_45075 [Polyangiaceae bacterium]|nr:hypothetical protein [Polyangiaceae bacterium]
MKKFISLLTLAAIASIAYPADAEVQRKATERSASAGSSNRADAPPPVPRESSVDLSLVWVPFGMHYTRSAWGATLGYKVPLVKRPGILWDSTNVTIGVRDLYGYVNNTFGPFIEITPIAFFKLRMEAAYDYFIYSPFNGGLRVLTPLGHERLAEGRIERGNTSALDWSGDAGVNNIANYENPINIGGTRLRVMPTLQGKVGPIVFQYNFMADFNLYRAPGASYNAVFHDTFTFTLRKLHDVSQTHELVVGYAAPVTLPGELLLGITGRYNRVFGTGLDQFSLVGFVFARLPRKLFKQKVSPFAAAQLGTLLVDPMWQYAFSWVTVVGADINLHKSKPYYIPADKP